MSKQRSAMGKLKEKFGDKIRAMRQDRGWSQDELARKLEWRQPNVSELESGIHAPSLPTLAKLAEVFKVPLSDLF